MAKRGRPPGAKTQDAITIDVVAGLCPMCGSRSTVWSVAARVARTAGICPLTGRRFDRVKLTRKKCRQCGTVRIERKRQCPLVTDEEPAVNRPHAPLPPAAAMRTAARSVA